MKFELLADNENAIPVVANWYFNEWGHLSEENSLAIVTSKLYEYLNTDKVPLIVLAVEHGEILGAGQLKYREMNIYPEKEHWLGGVYVSVNYRGNNIAEKIIGSIVSIAAKIGVQKLYLQTERLNGGLYSRLGWQPVEQVNYHGINVLVMERNVGV